MSPAIRPGPAPDVEDRKGSGFPLPKLRFEIRDLSNPSAWAFLHVVHATEVLQTACHDVLRNLYLTPAETTTTAPNVRSITLIMRDMPGVAHTLGSELDPEYHKETHLSFDHIRRTNPELLAEEIKGVITHEFVHCFQYFGRGTCPGGLIEGIADWVRLRCGLAPPHWRRSAEGKWDSGYGHTAYFLDYVENRFGEGTVRRLNEKLRVGKYEEKMFWTELVGYEVEQLWKDYKEKLKDDEAVVVNKEDVSGDEGKVSTQASTG